MTVNIWYFVVYIYNGILNLARTHDDRRKYDLVLYYTRVLHKLRNIDK